MICLQYKYIKGLGRNKIIIIIRPYLSNLVQFVILKLVVITALHMDLIDVVIILHKEGSPLLNIKVIFMDVYSFSHKNRRILLNTIKQRKYIFNTQNGLITYIKLLSKKLNKSAS